MGKRSWYNWSNSSDSFLCFASKSEERAKALEGPNSELGVPAVPILGVAVTAFAFVLGVAGWAAPAVGLPEIAGPKAVGVLIDLTVSMVEVFVNKDRDVGRNVVV